MKKMLKWLLPAAGLWVIAFGVTAMFRPLSALITFALFIGIGMFVSGIAEIASFIGQGRGSRSGLMLASGIMSTLLGIWVMVGRGVYAIALILPFVFAVWVLASGITRVVDSISQRSHGYDMDKWQLAFGILGTMAGFSLLFNPLMSAVLVSFTLGFMLISHGVGTIELFFKVRKLEKEAKDAKDASVEGSGE